MDETSGMVHGFRWIDVNSKTMDLTIACSGHGPGSPSIVLSFMKFYVLMNQFSKGQHQELPGCTSVCVIISIGSKQVGLQL